MYHTLQVTCPTVTTKQIPCSPALVFALSYLHQRHKVSCRSLMFRVPFMGCCHALFSGDDPLYEEDPFSPCRLIIVIISLRKSSCFLKSTTICHP